MSRNKALLLVGSAAMLLLLLAGCAPATEPGEPEPAVTVVEVKETVVVEATAAPEEAAKDPVRIGVALPFSGPVAFSGEGAMMGITMAMEELGWQVAGHPIEIYNADNECNPDLAVSAARKLIDVDDVHLIYGSGCSSCTLAVMPILPEVGISQVTGTSTNPNIFDGSGPGRNEWQFHVNVDDRISAEVFAPYVAEKADSVAILAYSDDFGTGVVEVYEPLFEEAGVEIKLVEYFDRGVSDIRPALIKILEADPEAIFLTTTEQDAVVIFRQMKELGLPQKVYVRGTFLTGLFLEMT